MSKKERLNAPPQDENYPQYTTGESVDSSEPFDFDAAQKAVDDQTALLARANLRAQFISNPAHGRHGRQYLLRRINQLSKEQQEDLGIIISEGTDKETQEKTGILYANQLVHNTDSGFIGHKMLSTEELKKIYTAITEVNIQEQWQQEHEENTQVDERLAPLQQEYFAKKILEHGTADPAALTINILRNHDDVMLHKNENRRFQQYDPDQDKYFLSDVIPVSGDSLRTAFITQEIEHKTGLYENGQLSDAFRQQVQKSAENIAALRAESTLQPVLDAIAVFEGTYNLPEPTAEARDAAQNKRQHDETFRSLSDYLAAEQAYKSTSPLNISERRRQKEIMTRNKDSLQGIPSHEWLSLEKSYQDAFDQSQAVISERYGISLENLTNLPEEPPIEPQNTQDLPKQAEESPEIIDKRAQEAQEEQQRLEAYRSDPELRALAQDLMERTKTHSGLVGLIRDINTAYSKTTELDPPYNLDLVLPDSLDREQINVISDMLPKNLRSIIGAGTATNPLQNAVREGLYAKAAGRHSLTSEEIAELTHFSDLRQKYDLLTVVAERDRIESLSGIKRLSAKHNYDKKYDQATRNAVTKFNDRDRFSAALCEFIASSDFKTTFTKKLKHSGSSFHPSPLTVLQMMQEPETNTTT